MLTRVVASLAFVAFFAVPAAFADSDCPFGHYTTTHTADADVSAPQTVAEAPAESPLQTVVDDPTNDPVTIAEVPTIHETTQD